jgi:outer membrane lipoprotein-sorting protein
MRQPMQNAQSRRPFRCLLCALMLALVGLCAHAAELDIQQLLSDFARKRQGHATFVETKYLAVLDRPLTSSGTLSFAWPSRIEKITVEPKPESLVLDDQTLTVQREGKTLTVDLNSHRQILSFVAAIRGILMGDFELLRRDYKIELHGGEDAWEMSLTPQDKQLAELIRQIKIGGVHRQVRSIEYIQRDGDRSVMKIEPASEGP